MQLAGAGADQFVELRLDVRMHVFVIAVSAGGSMRSQRAEDRIELVRRSARRHRERARPGDRAFDVLVEQLAVERERVVEPPQQLRRLALEASAPQLLRQPAAFRSRAAVTSSAGSVSSRLRVDRDRASGRASAGRRGG